MGVRGRPLGSCDQRPRERRSKLQYELDRFLGVQKPVKRQLHVAMQKTCWQCGSCIHVAFQPDPSQSPVPPFMVEALKKSVDAPTE